MSAADNSKTKPPAETIKDAEVVSTPRDDQPVMAKPITFAQQVFIWSMVLLVGVIFGVGSSWTFLEQGGRTIDGVEQTDIILSRQVADNLQVILQGSNDRFALRSDQDYAQRIRLARIAAARGLKPAGADLDLVVKEFLAKSIPNSTRTYQSLLAEHISTKHEVTLPQLQRYLADRSAISALFARNLIAPAIPLTVGPEVERVFRTKITADQVVLSAAHLLQPVAVDDPEIQTTYDKLRPTRFTRRAQVTVTIVAPDLAALSAAAVIAETDIAAWYESHKELYRKPTVAPAPDAPAPDAPAADKAPVPAVEYKPLTEVSAEIKTTLARAEALKKGQQAIEDFNRAVEEKGLETAERATFIAAATAGGLALTEKLVVDESEAGNDINLAAFGRIKDPAGIFSKDPGFITSPLQSGTPDRQWFIMRVDDHQPPGFQPLEAVRDEVQKSLAGRRAYKQLLDQAELLRAAAEKAGPGGLKQVLADPANVAWKATVIEVPLSPLSELRAPPTEQGGIAGEPRLAVSLAMPERHVVVVVSDNEAVVPEVRLLQVATISQDTTQPPMEASRTTEFYRQQLLNLSQRQFDIELRDQLGK